MLGYNLGSTFGFEHVPAGIGGLIIGTQPLADRAPCRAHRARTR